MILAGAIAAAVTPEKLRELRRAAGLTQAELAERLGLDRTTITRAERGERRVDMALLARWASVCGSTIDLGQPQAIDDARAALVADLDRLAGSDLEIVASLVALLPALSTDNRRTLTSLLRAWSVKDL